MRVPEISKRARAVGWQPGNGNETAADCGADAGIKQGAQERAMLPVARGPLTTTRHHESSRIWSRVGEGRGMS